VDGIYKTRFTMIWGRIYRFKSDRYQWVVQKSKQLRIGSNEVRTGWKGVSSNTLVVKGV